LVASGGWPRYPGAAEGTADPNFFRLATITIDSLPWPTADKKWRLISKDRPKVQLDANLSECTKIDGRRRRDLFLVDDSFR